MIVASNTSPLCYLILTGSIDLLPRLYREVHATQSVITELSHPDAHDAIRLWAARPPGWLKVHADPIETDQSLASLHLGERTAIRLAEQLKVNVVLLDDGAAREIAVERKLRVSGLLGVLKDASQAGLLDLPTAIDRLRKTSFRASPELLRSLLKPT